MSLGWNVDGRAHRCIIAYICIYASTSDLQPNDALLITVQATNLARSCSHFMVILMAKLWVIHVCSVQLTKASAKPIFA